MTSRFQTFRLKGVMFSSFIVAVMVAASFAYFNYKFSRFNFIDFSEWIFYTGDNEIFAPKEEAYVLLVYSGMQEEATSIIRRVRNKNNLTVLAVDLAQGRKPSENGVIYLTAGMNSLLNVVHRFHIVRSPSALLIERQKGALYKQGTLREEL